MHKILGVLSLILSIVGLIVQFSGNDRPSYPDNRDWLKDLAPQNKYWILNRYADNILSNKAIAKYSEDPLVWSAVVLRIEDDTLYAAGTMGSAKIRKESGNVPGIIEQYGQRFNFSYQHMTKQMTAINLSRGVEIEDRFNLYRPITETEYLALIAPEDEQPLQQGMNRFFVKELFAGEYAPLDRKSKKMNMLESGEVEGFQQYNHFKLHDYFGTSHPFNGLDVIWMEDKRGKGKYYNWVFAGDTLTLTEMKSRNDEEFFPGEKSWRFLKEGMSEQVASTALKN